MVYLTGAQLKTLRETAGLTRNSLALIVELSPYTIRYYERLPIVNRRRRSVHRMLVALGAEDLSEWRVFPTLGIGSRGQYLGSTARTRSRGFTSDYRTRETAHAIANAMNAKRRVICGAQTRRGTACKRKSEPGKTRCKLHGGKSTGPKSDAGRKRISEAQQKRWAVYRALKMEEFV